MLQTNVEISFSHKADCLTVNFSCPEKYYSTINNIDNFYVFFIYS